MSWQAYVDDQLISKNLKKAAIAGLDGNIWAKVRFIKIYSMQQNVVLFSLAFDKSFYLKD